MNLTTNNILLIALAGLAVFFFLMAITLLFICKSKDRKLEELNEELEIEQPWELLDEEGHYAIPFATELFLYHGSNIESQGTVLKNYRCFSKKGIEKFLDSGDFSEALHPSVTFYDGAADSDYWVIETELKHKFLVKANSPNFPEEIRILRKKKQQHNEHQENGQQ